MAENIYPNLNPERTALLAKQIAAVIGENFATYGLTKTQCDLLKSTATATQAGDADVLAKKSAYSNAVTARDASAAGCTGAIASAAALIYRAPGVTSAMIRDLGLAPRATTKTKVVPQTPTGVEATVDRFGNGVVSFKRAGNAPGVIFRLESCVPGEAWESMAEGTATRFKVPALPVEPRLFRVVAVKNGLEATPTSAAGVYGAPDGAARPALRLAA